MMRGKSILVIDDERRIVEILDSFLTLQGFEVKKAYDGQEGLNILKSAGPVDLIILDEKMPGMGGAAFLEEMKKLKMDIPVVVLTGSIAMSQLDNSAKRTYKHVLVKPVRLSELLELMDKLLASKARKTSSRKAEKDK
jgi:DNA-binding NtrC family response regulator